LRTDLIFYDHLHNNYSRFRILMTIHLINVTFVIFLVTIYRKMYCCIC